MVLVFTANTAKCFAVFTFCSFLEKILVKSIFIISTDINSMSSSIIYQIARLIVLSFKSLVGGINAPDI